MPDFRRGFMLSYRSCMEVPVLVVECLTGLGLKDPETIRIISSGSPGAVSAGLARAIVACLAMK